MDFFFCVSWYGIVNQPFIYPFFIYPSLASSAKSLFRFSLTNLNLFILQPSEQFLKANACRSFPAYFEDFFRVSRYGNVSQLFIHPSLAFAKSFFWFSLANSKFSVNVCSFLGFPSVEIKSDDGYQIGRRIFSDILYHVISFIQ